MKTFKHSSSNYINYLDHTNSSKISVPEDTSKKDNLANIIKNNVLIFDKDIYEKNIIFDDEKLNKK